MSFKSKIKKMSYDEGFRVASNLFAQKLNEQQTKASTLGSVVKINPDGTIVVLMSNGTQQTVQNMGLRQHYTGSVGLIENGIFV